MRLHVNAAAQGWENGALHLAHAGTGEDLPPLSVRTLVFAGARLPDPALPQALAAAGIAHRVIGDAEAAGTIQAAVYSGHRHARDILGQGGPARRETPVLHV